MSNQQSSSEENVSKPGTVVITVPSLNAPTTQLSSGWRSVLISRHFGEANMKSLVQLESDLLGDESSTWIGVF